MDRLRGVWFMIIYASIAVVCVTLCRPGLWERTCSGRLRGV